MKYFLSIFLITLLFSCKKDTPNEQVCDSTEWLEQYADYLAGEVGDTLHFTLEDGSGTYFIVENKTLIIPQGVCQCNRISMKLSNDSDELRLYYNNFNNVGRDEGLVRVSILGIDILEKSDLKYTNISLLAKSSGVNCDIRFINSFTVNNIVFENVLVFENFSPNNTPQIHKLVLAKEYGIIQIEKFNGEILTAKNLGTKLPAGLDTFETELPGCI